ncbi:MAG: hypothetical protein H0U26_09805 [Acidimicrobiia bacterium]|nr:hypothetical protein [Acidimicrobiia bacterium]
MTDNHPTVWPILSYRDAPAGAAFLVAAFGFEERAAYARDGDPSVIEHGEMRWPLGGGIMFGTAGKDDSPFGRRTPGNDSVYVVCDDPDALFDRAVAAGVEPKLQRFPSKWRRASSAQSPSVPGAGVGMRWVSTRVPTPARAAVAAASSVEEW